MGPFRDRPVCNTADAPTTSVPQLETGPRLSRSRHSISGLEPECGICTPSMLPDRPDTPEGDSSACHDHTNSSSLAEPTLVPNSAVSASGLPSTPPTGTSDSLALTELRSADGEPLPTTGRMEGLRRQLSARCRLQTSSSGHGEPRQTPTTTRHGGNGPNCAIVELKILLKLCRIIPGISSPAVRSG